MCIAIELRPISPTQGICLDEAINCGVIVPEVVVVEVRFLIEVLSRQS
jgi:hypothetical protein